MLDGLSEIRLFSGYVDSDGLKICQGDTVSYLAYEGVPATGTVKYGEYEDGERYMDNIHCGWYILNDKSVGYRLTTTLPDAVVAGNIHIIGGKLISRQ
jgi:hypothetical protein